jgi:hypothetical protein
MKKATLLSAAFILFAVCFFLFACKKHTPELQLPPITETGANTFACKVNGKVWLPYWPCNQTTFGSTELRFWVMPVSNNSALPIQFALQAENINEFDGSGFTIAFRQAGIFIYSSGNVADSLAISFRAAKTNNNLGFAEYRKYLNLGTNVFQVTRLDTVNKIFAGTFNLMLYSFYGTNNVKDSVSITDGRFDLKMGIQYEKPCSN